LSVLEEETGSHFRYVLPGAPTPEGEGERILARLSQILGHGYRYVVGSGSLPPGIPPEFYGRLADLSRGHGAKVVLDTQGEALHAALPFHPPVIRLADYEARELVGSDRGADALASDLIAQTSAEMIVITLARTEPWPARPPSTCISARRTLRCTVL
jgi:6-phosphofructokinase 2